MNTFFSTIRKRISISLEGITSDDLKLYSKRINKIQTQSLLNTTIKDFKRLSLVLFFLFSTAGFCQDSLKFKKKNAFFAFTPNQIEKVNGLALGLSLEGSDQIKLKQKVNGLNLEVNPLSVLIVLFADPRGFSKTESCVVNGLHISSGNLSDSKINGVALTTFNINHSINGFSINGIYSYAKELNGFHISGISNMCETANGVTIAFFNESESMKGFQLGAFNQAKVLSGFQLGLYNNSFASKGLQIGLINVSKKHKGLQIGLWNINHKRSMPFINW
ncbi:LA_2272 family surface repeat-containing protein [Flavobacterium sp.]|uniref:LA_2272 family surface repeat-containing protein n=1 Tax=Flavobacterium sp. TaxID=239 RepID=UPI003F6A3C4F